MEKNIHSPNKIAIIHDWFLEKSIGGAEYVTKVIDQRLTDKYTQPDIYSIVENLKNSKKELFGDREIKTTFIQKLPFGKSNVQNYLPLIPFAIEQFDLNNYDFVLSSSHLAAKGSLNFSRSITHKLCTYSNEICLGSNAYLFKTITFI